MLLLPLPLFPLLLGACQPECGLGSNLPGFTPVCEDATLAIYPEETRIVVLGAEGGAMVVYLPAPIEELDYGGTTGRPIDVIVDNGDREFTSGVPDAELIMTSIGGEVAGAAMTFLFPEGWVHGSVILAVEHRE